MRQVMIAHWGCVFDGNKNVRGRARRLFGDHLKVARRGPIRLHKACQCLNIGALYYYSRWVCHSNHNTIYRDRHIILGSSNREHFMNMRVKMGL